MNYFLDKAGLQHLIEKVQTQLGNYLSLSGGVIGGGQSYSDISNSGLHIYYSGDNTDYETIRNGNCDLKVDGLYISMDSTGFRGNAVFNAQKCEVPKFVLTKKEQEGVGYVIEQEGLLANDSTEVVKELSDDQVDKLLAGDTSTISDSKYYVSGANLGRFAQNVAKDKAYTIICASGGNVEVETSSGNITIEPGVNYRIDGDYSITSGKENVDTIVQSGPIQDSNKPFSGMVGLTGIDVARLDTSNVTDMSSYFAKCTNLLNFGLFYRDLSGWDTRKVTTFEAMFMGCELATSIMGINVWDTRNVSNMNSVFANCRKLTSLDLSGWSTQSVYSMEMMFSNCSAITNLTLGEGFGRMHDSVGTLDLSALTKWTGSTVDTLLDLYDRKANGMGVITIKLSSATKNALGTSGINTMAVKGYTIA